MSARDFEVVLALAGQVAGWLHSRPFEPVLADELVDRLDFHLQAVAACDRQAPMSAKILHDRGALPALDALLAQTRDTSIGQLTNTLAAGFSAKGPAGARLRALIALALDFWTWQRLTQEGLSDDTAARLVTDIVACAAASASPLIREACGFRARRASLLPGIAELRGWGKARVPRSVIAFEGEVGTANGSGQL